MVGVGGLSKKTALTLDKILSQEYILYCLSGTWACYGGGRRFVKENCADVG